MIKLSIIFAILIAVQAFNINKQQYQYQSNFNISLNLSNSIFENYYCGNVDGFPHFKLKYSSQCENNITHQIYDREFWNDGTSPSTFFYLYYYMHSSNQTIPQQFEEQIQYLINDWNLTEMRDILLWDKLKVEDRYGVGNDDRLWYAISFMQIQEILAIEGDKSQESYYELASEIFDWVSSAYENEICGGGVFWDVEKAYKNSITNHLYIDLAMYLHSYTQNSTYITQAKTVADWELNKSNLLDKDYLFFDGAYKNKICPFIDKSKWTYNQGVFMRGYLELSSLLNDTKYENVVIGTIRTMILNNPLSKIMSDNSTQSSNPLQFRPDIHDPNYIILLEFKNTKYSETTATFKGIFMRYLGSAYTYFKKSPNESSQQICNEIKKYIGDNANYVYPLNDNKNSYGFYWNQSTPISDQTFTAGTTTTVLDLFALVDLIQFDYSQLPTLSDY